LREDIKEESFDTIIAFDLIEHLEHYRKFLKECKRVIRKGSVLILSTPNKVAFSGSYEKPWYPSHKKEFYIEELQNELKALFPNVELYGILPGVKTGIMNRIINMRKPRIFDLTKPIIAKIFNLLAKLFFPKFNL